MMFRLLAASAALLSAPLSAQSPRMLEPGKTVTARPAKADEPDLYLMTGEVGATITLAAKGNGPLSLSLFTSEGEPMLTAEGDGSASLEAILPATDAYMVAVAGGSTKQYELGLTSVAPDAHLALFSRHVGYAYDIDTVAGTTAEWGSCWVEPGVVYKFYIGEVPVYHELLRGWRENTYTFYPGQPSSTEKVSWDGRTHTRVVNFSDGSQKTYSYDITPEEFGRTSTQKNFRYKSYLCD